jgi:hypothetical protein
MLGDCYFISSLGTLARSNPSVIENMIINNGDGTYTVRFYTGTYGAYYNNDGSISDGFTNNAGTADYVTVNSMLPTVNGAFCFADYGANYASSTNALWIPLLEKAYAQWDETGKEGRGGSNTYGGIAGGWMATVDAQVLGHNATDYGVTAGTQQAMITALAANEAVTIGTDGSSNSNDTLPYGLYGSHAYAVIGYNSAQGGTFTLYNPWGFDQPGALTWADLEATTGDFVVANTSGGTPVISASSQSNLKAGVAVAAADAPAAGVEGGSGSDGCVSQAALAESNVSTPEAAAVRSDSASAAADATRTVFDRLGSGSDPAAFTRYHDGGHASDSLSALSVDGVFADGSRMTETALLG